MTRAFALEALDVALGEARRFAVAAKLDEHFVSELDHLRNVCIANKEQPKEDRK